MDIAVSLLDKQGLIGYEQQITAEEQNCEQCGFFDVPAECENLECADCGRDDDWRESIDCPFTPQDLIDMKEVLIMRVLTFEEKHEIATRLMSSSNHTLYIEACERMEQDENISIDEVIDFVID